MNYGVDFTIIYSKQLESAELIHTDLKRKLLELGYRGFFYNWGKTKKNDDYFAVCINEARPIPLQDIVPLVHSYFEIIKVNTIRDVSKPVKF